MREELRRRSSFSEPNHKNNSKNDRFEARMKLILKQSIAVAVIIIGGILINRSGFEFGRNCISALGRAVKYNFDFIGLWNSICGFFSEIWKFWSEIF